MPSRPPFSGKQLKQRDKLARERKAEFILSTREKLLSISEEIEIKNASMTLRAGPVPQEDWLFCLPPHFSDFGREQIWQNVLRYVFEPQDIINLWETCVLFRDLLHEKYKAVKLAKAVEVCVEKGVVPYTALYKLRRVSRTTKNYIEHEVMAGTVGENDHLKYLIPRLGLRVANNLPWPWSRIWLRRLTPLLEGKIIPTRTFPLRKVIFEEHGFDFSTELVPLWTSIQRLFELVGGVIRSFAYLSQLNSQASYNNLQGWVVFLPNLEVLSVGIRRVGVRDFDADLGQVHAFPTLAKLKRYFQGEFPYDGLSRSHVGSILQANPGLEVVKLSPFSGNMDLRSLLTDGTLSQHQLQTWGVVYDPEARDKEFAGLAPFLQLQVQWPLRRLEVTHMHASRYDKIPAVAFFTFFNQFGATLEELKAFVEPSKIRDCKLMLELPHLRKLEWCLSDSQGLKFMTPLKKLEYFDMCLYDCFSVSVEESLQYLGTYQVPGLFPAMRRIRVGKDMTGRDLQVIWEK